jgi:hypothetical protein
MPSGILIPIFIGNRVKIRRHIMIRPEATPYDEQFKDYFIQRKWCKTRVPNGAISQELETG